MAALVGVTLVAAGIAGFLVRIPLADTSLRMRVIHHLEKASGLSVTAAGPMALRLLPRPTVDIADLRMTGVEEAVAIDADALHGRLALADMLVGDLRVRATELDRPTMTFDLDRLVPLVRALTSRAPALPGAGGVRPRPLGFLHVHDLAVNGAVVRLVSQDRHRDTLVTGLTASLDWPSASDNLSVEGQATWRGQPLAFTILADAPDRLIGGEPGAASIRLKSSILDLSIDATTPGTGAALATGKLNASTPDLAAFLKLVGTPAPQLAAFHQARIGGDATLSADTLSLSDLQFGLDGMSFEGAMAFNDHGGRPGLVGTLAADQIDLGPFLAALPRLADETGWATEPFDTRSVADDAIDLRISASQAKLGKLLFEDGSLSLQSGEGRMELSLGEARAYDGLLKGRLVATLNGDMTEVRADATMSRLDLTSLAGDLVGSDRLRGTTTGHVALVGRGRTPIDLIASLNGHGQLSVRNGEIGTALVEEVVKSTPSTVPLADAFLPADVGSFDSASIDFEVEQGGLALRNSWILWPGVQAIVSGTASLPQQTADFHAVVGPVSDGEAPRTSTAFGLGGPWRDLRLKTERNGF